MTKHYKFSRRINWIVLLCFLLPFFEYTGCNSPEEKAAQEAARAQMEKDSLAASSAIAEDKTADTLLQTTVKPTVEPINTIDTVNNQEVIAASKTIPEKEKISEILADTYPIIKPLLSIKPNYYSGLAYLIDSCLYLMVVFIVFSFVFLTLCLIIRYIDKEARIAICLLDILSLVTLYYTPAFLWLSGFNVLWGYWFCFLLLSALTIYDIYIAVLKNKIARTNQQA